MHENTKNRISFHKLKQMIRTNSIDKIGENRNRKKNMNFLLQKSTPIEIYKKQIEDTPKTKCPKRSKLQFRKNISNIGPELEKMYINISRKESTLRLNIICKSCKTTLDNAKLPHFATPEQIRRNNPLQIVTTLSELEERLVALRIFFSQIRQCGYKRSQMGLTGSIINVPVHMDIVQKSLPQFMNNTMTISIALK